MGITISQLRADIFHLLDQVLETGEPLVLERRGKILLIVPEVPPQKLTRLERHEEYLKGDPEEIVHMDWSSEWRP